MIVKLHSTREHLEMLNHLFLTRVTQRMPLVEQELRTIPERLSSPVFSRLRVTQSVLFCVVVDTTTTRLELDHKIMFVSLHIPKK
jgi:hypothetical protein